METSTGPGLGQETAIYWKEQAGAEQAGDGAQGWAWTLQTRDTHQMVLRLRAAVCGGRRGLGQDAPCQPLLCAGTWSHESGPREVGWGTSPTRAGLRLLTNFTAR